MFQKGYHFYFLLEQGPEVTPWSGRVEIFMSWNDPSDTGPGTISYLRAAAARRERLPIFLFAQFLFPLNFTTFILIFQPIYCFCIISKISR